MKCQRTTAIGKYSHSLFIATSLLNFCSVQSSCANGDIRLVNGTTAYEGRVEICYGGVWGSVCDSGWDYRDAAIVCLQLGFQGASK